MVSRWETVPNLPPNLESLGNTIQSVFPNRDQASDGAWGDAAHKLSPSGHNLDDTPGSLSETDDPDRIPELRAIDVDSDLRHSRLTMTDVVEAIRTSSDRNRLYYIIYRGRICGTWTGWAWTAYSGSNGHYEHAHFSGEPGSDENGSVWKSVTNLGDDMNLDDKIGGNTGYADRTVRDVLQDLARRHEWENGVYGSAPFVPKADSTLRNLEKVRAIDKTVAKLDSDVAALAKQVDTLTSQLSQLVTLLKDSPR